MPAATAPIGANLVRARRARGLTQEELAARSGVSVDVIARLEQARKKGARWTTLTQLAHALGVDVATLLSPGRCLRGAVAGGAMEEIQGLRRAVADYHDLLGNPSPDLSNEGTVDDLERGVAQTWRALHRGEVAGVVTVLPAMISDARRLIQGGPSAAAALSGCYLMAAGVAATLGQPDLAFLAVGRAADSARGVDSLDAAVPISLSLVLIRQGRYMDAEQCAVLAAGRIEPTFSGGGPAQLAAFGNLMINASCAAARSGAHERADHHLAVARAAAARFPVDGHDRWCVFGPRAVAMCHVANAVERHDPDAALRYARDVPPPSGGSLPATWEAWFALCTAFAQAEAGHDSAALAGLVDARRIAPEWTKHHPLAETVVLTLLQRLRRPCEELAHLAAYLNVL